MTARTFPLVLLSILVLLLALSLPKAHAAYSPLSRLLPALAAAPGSPAVLPSRSAGAPVLFNMSGCARQLRNWTVDCQGGERLTMKVGNFQWIDTVRIQASRDYICQKTTNVDEHTVSCVVPGVVPQDVGKLLIVNIHDQVSDLWSTPTYALEFNTSTTNRTQ